MKHLLFYLFLMIGLSGIARSPESEANVQLNGNAYVTSVERQARITDRGLEQWTGKNTIVSVFFAVPAAGTYDLSLRAKGNSLIKVSCAGKDLRVKLSSDNYQEIVAGKMKADEAGYVRVDLAGIRKSGATFGEIESLKVKGAEGEWVYVRNFSTYWGRRGPSVHLKYQMPQDECEWFYNEVTVPKEGEVIGSYYMANGFGEGYFGMQYNSETERRILFSVWSPFDTQDPKKIPEADRIRMLRRGEDVHIGEFGNEGSGGQSYLKYNWKAGVTYPFLMQVHPDGKGNTIYTAYFYATDQGRWRLIASFLRPKTNTWYRNAHSFLENFSPEQGYLSRKVFFNNQWVRTREGKWKEVVQASFTYDATAGAGVRKDYQGGLAGREGFYLKNGGFFDGPTSYGMIFKQDANQVHPEIDFNSLEKL